MIVADYARKADEVEGIALSSYYFRKLSEYLGDNNYNISQTYRTCVIKVYEKGLGVGSWGQDRKLLQSLHEVYNLGAEHFTDILKDEVRAVNPTVIIAMGEYALRILTGREGITNYRGSVLPCRFAPKAKVVVCQHLSIEHTQEEQKFLIRMDLAKAVDLLLNPVKPIDAHEVIIARTTNDYLRYRSNYPDSPEWMTSDIETRAGFITCASTSFDGYRGACVPLVGSSIDPMEKCRMARLLAVDLENPAIKKNNQNIGYDKRIYQRFGFRVTPVKWDTMLAASVIAAEFPKRLGFLTSIYCDGAYHKDEGKEPDSWDQLYEYCAKDSIKTHQIMIGQRKDLESLDALGFFEDFIMRLFDVYYDLDSVGLRQDAAKREALKAKYEGLYNLKLLELQAITGTPLKNLAYAAVGGFMETNQFPVLRHRVESGYMIVNTDAESLKKMRSAAPQEYKKCLLPYEHAVRFINLILLLRRIDKILEALDVGVHYDGRIRTSSKLGGTASGRTSGGKTADQVYEYDHDKKGNLILESTNLGTSFQTVTKHGFIVEGDEDGEIDDSIIGKDIREMYTPDPGWVIVSIDRSQAEARVVDLLAEDYEGLEEYGKIDKHSKIASIIWTQYTWEEIKKRYKDGEAEGAYMRQIGKKGKHATNYDMGDFRLSNLANIPITFAHQVLVKIHAACPQIKGVFHFNVDLEVRKHRRLDNPLGRPRMWYKKLDGHGIKVAYSWYPQSTISDSTKRAMLKIVNEVDRTRCAFVAENHDSIDALVKLGYVRTYVNIARRHLTEGIDFRRGTFYRDYNLVIPVDVHIGRKNWGEMREMRKIKAA